MLQLKNIVKTYTTGDFTQHALNGVSVSFRENEFVSILGQSGSGKTTMLNIIGGLDRYTSGDLVIDGVSTKDYKDSDWDYYRNNSIGFVFQSYNLIPHQTVLANVEMALTLAGVSPKERKQRAITVLKKVGLGDQLHKKPNQMSGGQMQRVAIARALVNNPDILLADEPTGALDSDTSIQIMELLSEIAKDKLVIMVTHNPELAEQYSTRIVRLKDGRIIDDTDPYRETEALTEPQKKQKISMSFGTALALSFNNLRTKKSRTLLTAFAGSIGIIGIALILALSTGMNAYIENVQKETMTSYPITISSETIDMSGLLGVRAEVVGAMRDEHTYDANGVVVDYEALKASTMLTTSFVENNLTAFKKYLDDPNSEIHAYLGENGVQYTYDVAFQVYSHDTDGTFVSSDMNLDGAVTSMNQVGIMNRMSAVTGGSSESAENFSEIMAGANGELVSPVIVGSYDVLYGRWPESYDEVVLVLDKAGSLSAGTLCQLGLLTKEQYTSAKEKIEAGEEADALVLSYEELATHTFYLVPACDGYAENEDGTFRLLDDLILDEAELIERALPLRISGIVRPMEDADNADISTTVAYTSALTEYIIDHTDASAIVQAQERDPATNVLTGMPFTTTEDTGKAEDAKIWLSSLGISEKASFYKLMMTYASSDTGATSQGAMSQGGMSQDATDNGATMQNMAMDEVSMAGALDMWLAGEPSEEILCLVYDEYLAGNTYEDNMKAFGKVSYDAPSSISIYTDTFENKDAIADCIARYNETADEDDQITYTDYVAMLTSSLTTIIDGISYVLVAFVSISLVVSCIMIGIITHISVMERTKEIGILRALGASKSNISQVFNAETFIIGCISGFIGILTSLLAMIPINAIIARLTGIPDLQAQLPLTSSLVLILISIGITILGGLLPASKAAKKDPVVALRTE